MKRSHIPFLFFPAVFLCALRPAFAQNTPMLSETAPAGQATETFSGPANAYLGTSLDNWLPNTEHRYMPTVPIQAAASVDSNSPAAEVRASVSYKDGFNRPFETVSRNHSVSGGGYHDLVSARDNYVRDERFDYLPYAVPHGAGAYRDNFSEEQKAYYQDKYPDEGYTAFSRNTYYSDGIIRQTRQYSPGKSQVGMDRGMTSTKTGNPSGYIRIWELDAAGNPVSPGFYAANTLFGGLVSDQEGNQTITYKDKDGHLVLKQVQDGSSTYYASTYYIYDELGRLRYILPPKATDAAGSTISATVLDNLCFQYQYDSKGRLSAQQKPGEQGFTYIVYDRKQRPVMRQTPKEAADHTWEVTFHDGQGHVIATSLYSDGDSRDTWQSLFDNYSGASYATNDIRYYLLSDAGEGVYPGENAVSGNAMMSYMYYDNYDLADPSGTYYNNLVNTLNFSEILSIAGAETPSRSMRTTGLVTGGRVRILPAPGQDTAKTGDWSQNINWYDDKGRQTYVLKQDLYHGVPVHTHYTGTQYNFSNQALISKHILVNAGSADGNTTHTELTKNIYDAATGQLLETDHSMDGSPWNVLVKYEYDDLGRVKRQVLGDYGEVRDYDYNIRGQVTGINGHYAETGETPANESRTFGESLKYDYGFSQPRYDGKTAGMVWRGQRRRRCGNAGLRLPL